MGTGAERSMAEKPCAPGIVPLAPPQPLPLPENSNRWRMPLWVANDCHEKASLFLQLETDQGAQRGATSLVNYTSLSRLSALCSFMPNDSTVTRFSLPLHGCLDASRLAAIAAQLQRGEERLSR